MAFPPKMYFSLNEVSARWRRQIKDVEYCIENGYLLDCTGNVIRHNVVPDAERMKHQYHQSSGKIRKASLQGKTYCQSCRSYDCHKICDEIEDAIDSKLGGNTVVFIHAEPEAYCHRCSKKSHRAV